MDGMRVIQQNALRYNSVELERRRNWIMELQDNANNDK